MTIEKSTPEELVSQFKERYQALVTENQQLAQKIKENETVALKLLGAIEALEYIGKEEVEKIIIGLPYQLDGSPTDATASVLHCIRRLKNSFPTISIVSVDEQFSSKMASKAMIDMGMKKKDRQKKGMVDEIAATLLLQEFMQSNQ